MKPDIVALDGTTGGAGSIFTNQTNGYYVLAHFNTTTSTLQLLRPDGNTATATLANNTYCRVVIPPKWGLYAGAALTVRGLMYWFPDLESVRGYI